MHATYHDGTPVFSPCSKLMIRFLQGLTLVGLAAHVVFYIGTHALANIIPKAMASISDKVMRNNIEDFV
jgi:maltodextrin utilization protein YvdJ